METSPAPARPQGRPRPRTGATRCGTAPAPRARGAAGRAGAAIRAATGARVRSDAPGRRLGAARRISLSEAKSVGERSQQPIEVVLVVPGPDRRAQPGPPGNVTNDDPLPGQ